MDLPTNEPDPNPRRWWALAVLSVAVVVIGLDNTVLNVALPTLVTALHPSSSQLQWIADGYTLANAVLLLLGGAVGDRIGRRRTFVFGMAVFGAASLVSALVTSAVGLIAARAVMGLGAAFLMPATLSLITSTFTQPGERARAIGVWSGVSGIGLAVGPLVGGVLLRHFWWGSVFLINVPVVVVALIAAPLVMRESRSDVPRRIDQAGVILSAVGLTAIVYGVIEAPVRGWASPLALGSLVGGLVVMALFVAVERTVTDPLVDVNFFRNRVFSAGSGAVALVFFALFGVMYVLTQDLQFVQGNDALGVGVRFTPLAISMAAGGPISARVAGRFGLRITMVAGLSLLATGIALLLPVTATSGYLLIGLSFACIGGGMGLTIAPASNAIMSSLPPNQTGSGSGLRSTVQFLGGAFGVAILGSLATGGYHSRMDTALSGPALAGLPASAKHAAHDQIGGAATVARQVGGGPGSLLTKVSNEAFVAGLHIVAVVGLVAVLLGMVVAATMIPRAPKAAVAPDSQWTGRRASAHRAATTGRTAGLGPPLNGQSS
ncbi:MAG: MFS transporter [Frankia sp.]